MREDHYDLKEPMSAKPEKDPNGIAAGQPGAKLDAGKSPVFQGVLDYFPRAVMAVANLSQIGANKYSWKGWEKVPNGEKRYADAMARHITRESIEGPMDPDGFLHATAQAWNALARLELMLRRVQTAPKDDIAAAWARKEQMDPVPYGELVRQEQRR